ncbi:MAG: hypothetical protein Kow00108_02930 [Calditrichia bacterium]
MKVQEHIEALSLALKTEEEGFTYFTEIANKTKNEFAQSLFRTLAMDEKKHIAIIKRFYDLLVEEGHWKEITEKDMEEFSSEHEIKTIFKDAAQKAKSGSLTISEDDIEAYRMALKFEDDGANMYDELAKKSTDSAARLFYSFLRDMEQGHYDTLKRTLDYLENPSDYYILEEGWTMED